MVSRIAELGSSDIALYHGDYDEYLVRAGPPRAPRSPGAQPAKRVAEIERFIERFRYQATKARQVQSRIKMCDDRVEVEPRPRDPLRLPQPPRTGRRVASLRAIHKAYGDNVVYTGVDFEVERGMRVAFVARTAPASRRC